MSFANNEAKGSDHCPSSGRRKIRTDHQINVTTQRLTPFPEFFSQGAVGGPLAGTLEGHQALVHQIEGVINQLSSLFRGHGAAGDGTGEGRIIRWRCSREPIPLAM